VKNGLGVVPVQIGIDEDAGSPDASCNRVSNACGKWAMLCGAVTPWHMVPDNPTAGILQDTSP
jgi:hypothetical protein